MAAATLLFMRLMAYGQYGRFLPRTPLNGFIVLYLLLSAIAFLVSPLPARSLPRLTVLLLGVFGYYAILDILVAPVHLHQLAGSLAMIGGIIAVTSPFLMEVPIRYIVDLRFLTEHLPHIGQAFTIHHNQVAGTLLLLLPLSAVLWLYSPDRWQRRLFATMTSFMALTLLLTQSRNAWLGLLVALAAVTLWGRFRFRYLLPLLILLLVLPFLLTSLPATLSSPLQHGLSVLDNASKAGSNEYRSWLSRLETWSVSVQMLRDYPVIGAGLDVFEPSSRANYVYQVVSPTFAITHPHNVFLQTGINLGWAGLFTITGLWGTIWYGLWRTTAPAEESYHWLKTALGASVVGYLSFNLFDIVAFEQRPGFLIWLILAMATRLMGNSLAHNRCLRMAQLAPALLFVLLCLTPALPHNWANLQLDRARLTAAPAPEGIAGAIQNDNRRLGMLLYLQNDIPQALRAWQADSDAVLFLQNQGQQAYYAGDAQTAVAWYTLALQVDPNAGSVYFWRGLAYETLDELDLALADYMTSIRHNQALDPASIALQAKAWAGAGWLYVRQEAWMAAAWAFSHAIDLAPQEASYQQQLDDVCQSVREQMGTSVYHHLLPTVRTGTRC